MHYCTIEESSNGIYANSSGAISVSNVTFQNNSYGINAITTATISVSDCQFQDNTYGISITGGSIDLGSTVLYRQHHLRVSTAQAWPPTCWTPTMSSPTTAPAFCVDDVAGLNLMTAMTITGSTTTGIHLKDCDGATVDNQILTGNAGTNGAFLIDDCGEFTLGAGNTIGGSGPGEQLAADDRRRFLSERRRSDPDDRQHQQRHPGQRRFERARPVPGGSSRIWITSSRSTRPSMPAVS